MQWLHDVWQNFVIFFSKFPLAGRATSLFCRARSYYASAK